MNEHDKSSVRWELEPFVGVGPLRFDMSAQEVSLSLGGIRAQASQGSLNFPSSEHYAEIGLDAIYNLGAGLVGVLVRASGGLQVSLNDLDLIEQSPVQLRKKIEEYAADARFPVKENWSGNPEVSAIGLSITVDRQGDCMLTEALFVSDRLADDPYGSEDIINWSDVRGEYSGRWGLDAPSAHNHRKWSFSPLVGVGPLEFGMRPEVVSDVLGGERPKEIYISDARGGRGVLEWEWYEAAGIVAHYGYSGRFLTAATINGSRGPRVQLGDFELIGAAPSVVENNFHSYIENSNYVLQWGVRGEAKSYELGLALNFGRCGNFAVSEVTFASRPWMDNF
ncbi:hypothetical protein ABT117_16705 [Streptomyces sp. NPDC002262]|uniref:hypothetical protein n=1 Tax=Streptomyces sp. NPDC002262 TaxID=3154414 RepID=UPI0033281E8A